MLLLTHIMSCLLVSNICDNLNTNTDETKNMEITPELEISTKLHIYTLINVEKIPSVNIKIYQWSLFVFLIFISNRSDIKLPIFW
ncbi:hypothetical protein MCHI_000339 [Candidatus Magnetoovum chiemensis]|nr:hypothetical protein MCHI_000339 [Candidatus Magnetoovum chiemensis]